MVKTEQELLDDYYDIILYLSAKFNNLVKTIPLEDLIQVSFLGALNAIRNYDPEIGPLRNYVFSSAKNYILRFLSKEKFLIISVIPLEEVSKDPNWAIIFSLIALELDEGFPIPANECLFWPTGQCQ